MGVVENVYIVTLDCPNKGNKEVHVKGSSEADAILNVEGQYPDCTVKSIRKAD